MLNLPCSVALVRVVHPGRISPKKILVPYRGRPAHPEEKAFFVGKLAEAFGASVTLFHAPEPISKFFADLRRGKPPGPGKQISREIDRFISYLEQHRISPQKRFGHGPSGRAAAWCSNIAREPCGSSAFSSGSVTSQEGMKSLATSAAMILPCRGE